MEKVSPPFLVEQFLQGCAIQCFAVAADPEIFQADPPAAPGAMAAQIVHLQQLHGFCQQTKIFPQLSLVRRIIDYGISKYSACVYPLDLPGHGLTAEALDDVFGFHLRQTNGFHMFGVAYEGIRKLKAGTAFRAPEHALNNGIVIFEIRHFFNFFLTRRRIGAIIPPYFG